MPSAVMTTPTSPIISQVSIINDVDLGQYDILQISFDLYSKLFPESSEDTPHYVLIKLLGAPDFFNKFQIYQISSIDYNLTNSVKFVNNSNLNRFKCDNLTLNQILIQPIVDANSIPKLSQLFISVPNEVYTLLHGKRKQELLNWFGSDVVNEGDVIRLINGDVELCEPVSQGRVDESTNVILIKKEQKKEENQEEEDEVEVNLSGYLTSNLQFDKQDVEDTQVQFKVRPLPERITPDIPESKDDVELFVFINTVDLIKLGFPIFNGDLIKLKTSTGNVLVRIFTFIEPNTFELGHVYVSPLLLINLDDTSVVEFEQFEGGSTLSSNIPIAESVTISRVCSQITMDKTYQRSFFSSLKTSLTNQLKSVKQGDFFPVVIDSMLAKTMFDETEEEQPEENTNNSVDVIPTGDPDTIAWFKIVEVKGSNDIGTDQFLIDPKKTLLVSSGIESCRLPKNTNKWYQYLQMPSNFNYFNTTEGSFKYAHDFIKIFQTVTTSTIPLQTTVLLNSSNRGMGKTTLVRNVSIEMGLNLLEFDCLEFINPGQELKTIGLITGKIDKLITNSTGDSFNVIYLKHIEQLCPAADQHDQNGSIFTSLTLKVVQTLQDYLTTYRNLVLVLSCNDYDKLNDNLKSLIKFNIEFTVPNEAERLQIFTHLIRETCNTKDNSFMLRKDVNLKNLALQSAGLTPRDLISIINKTKKLAWKRLSKLTKQYNISLNQLINMGNGGIITLIPEDFNLAINEARNQFSDSIGAPRIPNVKWEDIGGLDLVKDEILDTIDMPLKHPELFNNGLKKRSGILFYGPPGTGKTLLAKAIATNFSLNFFSVKGPELLNMYIGESEANVRRVFQKARDAKPCVIFFDELDSVAPKRGNQGDSGGVMDRIVSQLLAELDGMSASEGDGIFVVGATNRPDLLDEALLRPGRFDKLLYLGISDTDEKQTKILQALTRKFKLHDDVNLPELATNCSFSFTGADFYALCSDSMLNAMTRVANEVDAKIKKYAEVEGREVSTRWWFDNVASEEDITVLVRMQDFIKAQNELVPSVSMEELQHYLRVRENFEGNATNKSNGA
ncbi:Peroxisomal biogenesis factor 6 [Spathaspora sp. JA1]|nr:Peroxisomal biogenesis factor 6 [Spathaspora sp. JA1]